MLVRPYLLAACAALPLATLEVWTGYRVGLSDPLLGIPTPLEQPLSARSPGGVWAIGLILAWFWLACSRRDVALWEPALVLAGGVAALARAGNLWLDGVAIILPLGRQLALARPGGAAQAAIGLGAVAV